MSKDNLENGKPKKTDPRLKSFMRKAAAIIAAEKGLNAASRIKLESLAEHVKLPQDLLDEALVQLQSNDTANLTHYEKAFLKFLDREFAKIKGGVLSLGMEKRAIDRAESKYQINNTRAEQLIEAQAEAAGVGRISPDEAAVFAEQIIVDRVHTQVAVDNDTRQQLYKIGKKWAYSKQQVDRIIFREISRNRAERKSALLKNIAITLALLLAVVLGVGYGMGMFEPSNDIGKFPANSVNSKAPAPGEPESNFSRLQGLAKTDIALEAIVKKIAGSNATQRVLGYQQLARTVCLKNSFDNWGLPKLVQQLYYEEQSENCAAAILDSIENALKTRSFDQDVSITSLKGAYRANRILGQLCFSPENAKHSDSPRYLASKNVITNLVRIPIKENQRLDDYMARSDTAIATDQWNLLIESTWSSPARASLLYQPVRQITETKLAPETLSSFRDQALFSIVKADNSKWRNIQNPLTKTIQECDEAKLAQWVSTYVGSSNETFHQFAGPLLAKRLGLEPRTGSRVDVYNAISAYDSKVRNQKLLPVVSRNELLNESVNRLLLQAQTPKESTTPDQIAELALEVNRVIAFCSSIENVPSVDDASFAQFDRLVELNKPLLRSLVSLPIDRKSESRIAKLPTSSDIGRKNSALDRLSKLEPAGAGLRKLSIDQLARVVSRFDRLTYSEAEILANYLLADLGKEEFLNAQQKIEAFSKWPNVALAIADKLPDSNVKTDQAMTVARLLIGKDLDSVGRDDWKSDLRFQLYQAINSDVLNQIALDPNNVKSDWNRLEIYLNDAYQQRLMLSQKREIAIESFASPALASLALLENLKQNSEGETANEFAQANTIVKKSSANPIARIVLANQFLMKWIANNIYDKQNSAAAQKLLKSFGNQTVEQRLVGEQLYQSELMLLKLFELKRRSLVANLIRRNR